MDSKRTLIKFYSIGRTIFTSTSKTNKNTKKIMRNLITFCKRMSGTEELTKERELFTPLSNIGVITFNQLQLILKI